MAVRNVDPLLLHPKQREACRGLANALGRESIPLAVFEGWRSPQRQADLYVQDRVPSWKGAKGRHVTRSRPWVGRHSYGLACDYVFFLPGKGWTWKEPEKGMWDRFDKLARENGLESLEFERPHVQLAGIKLSDLRAGIYPAGGDTTWANNMRAAIAAWGPEPVLATVEGVAFDWPRAPKSPTIGLPPVQEKAPTPDLYIHEPDRSWAVPDSYVYDEETAAMCLVSPVA